jgi:hypothetical protein
VRWPELSDLTYRIVAGERNLFGHQRRRSSSLLQHQEPIRGLHADVQGGPEHIRAKPIHIRQRRGSPMAAARTRTRAAWISSLRSPARRTTSARLSGDGRAGAVWAEA